MPRPRPADGTLRGLERKVVFSPFRAAVGLRWEIPWLLNRVVVPSDSRCLEIGTGMGWGALGLVRTVKPFQVIATDYDGAILPPARTYLRQHGALSKVAFCQADAKRLPFRDSTFDLVLALYVLHHSYGYRRALREIGRVTSPGGRFLFIDFVRPPSAPRFRRWFPTEGLPTRREFVALLKEAGFGVELWRGPPIWVSVCARKGP